MAIDLAIELSGAAAQPSLIGEPTLPNLRPSLEMSIPAPAMSAPVPTTPILVPMSQPSPLPPPAPRPEEQQTQVTLRGIRIVDSAANVQLTGFETMGVTIEGIPMLEAQPFRERLQMLLGQPVSQELLQMASTIISDWYREHDYPFVDVALSAGQDITEGVVQVVVTESRAGKISARGNQWFSSGLLTSEVRLQPGGRISLTGLAADKDWLNQNPFRNVNITAEKSAIPGYTDIVIDTLHEALPFRVHATYDNDGVLVLGRDRYSVGFDWGNAFGLDHQLSYEYTSNVPLWQTFGPQVKTYQAHSASYLFALPWRDKISISGVYAVAVPQLGPYLAFTGITWQLSARYVIPLAAPVNFTHQIQAGFDFNSSNNDLIFGGFQIANVTAEIDQFLVDYSAALRDPLGQTSLDNTLALSPGGLSSHNTDEFFQAQVPFAPARYVYDRLSVTKLIGLPQDADWVKKLGWLKGVSSLSRFVGQISSNNLLPNEQLGIGGLDTIPGYDQRAANGSKGVFLSEELLSPPFGLTKYFFRDFGDQTQISAFLAYGSVKDNRVLSDTQNGHDLASVGLGLRYAIGRYVNLHLNYGWQLRRFIGEEHGAFGQLSLTVSD
jgi:hemolysin activation/secretion protein